MDELLTQSSHILASCREGLVCVYVLLCVCVLLCLCVCVSQAVIKALLLPWFPVNSFSLCGGNISRL